MSEYLEEFLNSPERPDGTLSYHEVQGFLFAVMCSPEMINPSEWLSLVFNDQDAGYADDEEAKIILMSLMAISNLINEQVFSGEPALPDDIIPFESAMDNVGKEAKLGLWSRGFLMGHHWLADIWEEYIPDELGEELGSSLLLLSFFSSQQLAEAYFNETEKNDEFTLADFSTTMLKLFDDAMFSYATLGHSIQTALYEESEVQEPYVKEEKTGRNDPCPCGSGKKYKRCCLH